MTIRSAIVTLCLLCALRTYAADVPTTINYQGRLVENGQLVNQGGMTMRLRLYDSSTATTPVVYEENDTVNVVDGLYTTLLGDNPSGGGTTADLQEALNTLGTNAWLGIKFGADPELMPRERLMSAPFAINVRGISVNADGQVGIGTDDPKRPLHVTGGPDPMGLHQGQLLFHSGAQVGPA